MKHIRIAALGCVFFSAFAALLAVNAAQAQSAQGRYPFAQTFYPIPLTVIVKDAETGMPIQGASVLNGEASSMWCDSRPGYEGRARRYGNSFKTDKDGKVDFGFYPALARRGIKVEAEGYNALDYCEISGGQNYIVPDVGVAEAVFKLKPVRQRPVPTPSPKPKPTVISDSNCIPLGIRQPQERSDAASFPCVREVSLNVPADGAKLQQLQSILVSGSVVISARNEAVPEGKWGITLALLGARKDSANTDRDLELVRQIVDLPGPAVQPMSTEKVPVAFLWTVPPVSSGDDTLYVVRIGVGPRDVATYPVKSAQNRIYIRGGGAPSPKPTPAEPPRYKELGDRLDALEKKINRVMEELRSELQELQRILKSLQAIPTY